MPRFHGPETVSSLDFFFMAQPKVIFSSSSSSPFLAAWLRWDEMTVLTGALIQVEVEVVSWGGVVSSSTRASFFLSFHMTRGPFRYYYIPIDMISRAERKKGRKEDRISKLSHTSSSSFSQQINPYSMKTKYYLQYWFICIYYFFCWL